MTGIENKVACALGHGECPTNCPGYAVSKALQESAGADYKPERSHVAMDFVIGKRSEQLNAQTLLDGCCKEKS